MRPDRIRSFRHRAVPWAVAVVVAFCSMGCQSFGGSSGPETATSKPRLEQILASGELRVGLSADLPPLSMKDKSGDFIGFEVDIATALAEAMGLEAQFVQRPFADLLPALERGDVDLVLSGLTITPERNIRVAFAGPYFISGTSFVAKAGHLGRIDRIASLDAEGRTYAALEGSTSAAFVTNQLPKASLVTVADYEAGVQKLVAGEADALVADHLACSMAVWKNPAAGLEAHPTPFTIEPLGIAMPADSPLLLNLVENYLTTLEATGLLARFKARWLADGSWISELP